MKLPFATFVRLDFSTVTYFVSSLRETFRFSPCSVCTVMLFWSTDSIVPRILSLCVAAIAGITRAVVAASIDPNSRVIFCLPPFELNCRANQIGPAALSADCRLLIALA
jgi:hypothetical protein